MVTRDDIVKLCSFSHLEFTEDEIPKLVKDFENIMRFTEQVSKYEYSKASCNCTTFSPAEPPTYRAIEDSSSQKDILSGGINKGGFFFIEDKRS